MSDMYEIKYMKKGEMGHFGFFLLLPREGVMHSNVWPLSQQRFSKLGKLFYIVSTLMLPNLLWITSTLFRNINTKKHHLFALEIVKKFQKKKRRKLNFR